MNVKIRNKFIEIKYSVSNRLGRIWDLIVSVPDYCLSFYFVIFIINYWWFRI